MTRIALVLLLLVCLGCGRRAPVTIPETGTLAKAVPGTHKKTVEVPGVGDVKYTIVFPANYVGDVPVPLTVVLHFGYDGAVPAPYTGAGMIDAFRPALSELNGIILAPDALGGDWTDARNEKAVVWLTKSAMNSYTIDPHQVLLTGYSLGGQGTWFIGSRHQNLFTAAIPVAAPVAGETDWTIPVYVIHSKKDQVVSFSAAKNHADLVKAGGAKVEFLTVPDLTHYNTRAYTPHVRTAITWLKGLWQPEGSRPK